MLNKIQEIEGGVHTDERGTLKFINEFDLKDISRVYIIEPSDTSFIRAWQGHKKECKYFLATKGIFTIGLVQVDNWETPTSALEPVYFILEANQPKVLCVPGGYANGIKANKANSQLMVFSSSPLEDAHDDEFRFPVDYWKFPLKL